MFTDHPLTPEIERDVAGTPSAEAIRRVFRDYATLLKSAERDRQALIGFVDNLDARLDEIPQDPDAARERAAFIARRSRGD